MASSKNKKGMKGGWGYYKRLSRPMKAVVIYISEEGHAKLKRKAYLEERTLQKVARRIIEDGVKDVELPEDGGNEQP